MTDTPAAPAAADPAAAQPVPAPVAPVAPAPAPQPAAVAPQPAPPALDVSTVVVAPAGPCAAFRAWEAAKCAAITTVLAPYHFGVWLNDLLTGLRTIIIFGVTGAIGLIDAFNGIDLSGLLESYIGTKVKVGDVITLMSIVAILLRMVSNTPLFQKWKHGAVSTATVDDPKPGA